MHTNGELDPVEAALVAVEENKAAEHAAKVNSALNELDSHIIMLRGMGMQLRQASPDTIRKFYADIERANVGKQLRPV